MPGQVTGLPAAAAATAAATFAATAAATTTTAATGALTLLRLVHLDGAAVELLPVHGRHRVHRVLGIRERNETEPAGAVSLAIFDHLRFEDFTKLFKCAPEPLVGGVPAQASNKQFLRHDTFSFERSRDARLPIKTGFSSDENLRTIGHTTREHTSYPGGSPQGICCRVFQRERT